MTRIEFEVRAMEPFAEGRDIGEAGPYLRIRGTAKGELDRRHRKTASSPISTRLQRTRAV